MSKSGPENNAALRSRVNVDVGKVAAAAAVVMTEAEAGFRTGATGTEKEDDGMPVACAIRFLLVSMRC